jgi:hypothetical protein
MDFRSIHRESLVRIRLGGICCISALIAEDGFRGLEDGNMFGRKLKKEYKMREYCIVDKVSGEVAETRYMPIRDPVMEVVSVGFVFAVGAALVYEFVISPFLGKLLLSDSNAILLFGILFAIGSCIAYYFMTERFEYE